MMLQKSNTLHVTNKKFTQTLDDTRILQLQKIDKEIELFHKKNGIKRSSMLLDGKLTTTSEFQEILQGKIICSGNIENSLIQAISNDLSNLMSARNIKEKIFPLKSLAIIKNDQYVKLSDPSPNGVQLTYFAIKNFVINEKIIHPAIHKNLQEFPNYETIEDESYRLLSQSSCLLTILTILERGNLNSTHHFDFVQQCAILNDKGDIKEIKNIT